MNFNGAVGDLGSVSQATYYDLSYRGKDLERLKVFVMEQVKRKGLTAVDVMKEVKEKEDWVVSVRVRSDGGKGII